MRVGNKRIMYYQGKGQSISDWAREYGHTPKALSQRLARGKWFLAALYIPPRNRTARFLTCDGLTLPLSKWSEITGIGYTTLWNRIKMGWTDEKIVKTPVKKLTNWKVMNLGWDEFRRRKGHYNWLHRKYGHPNSAIR
jgi:hypothetical protein